MNKLLYKLMGCAYILYALAACQFINDLQIENKEFAHLYKGWRLNNSFTDLYPTANGYIMFGAADTVIYKKLGTKVIDSAVQKRYYVAWLDTKGAFVSDTITPLEYASSSRKPWIEDNGVFFQVNPNSFGVEPSNYRLISVNAATKAIAAQTITIPVYLDGSSAIAAGPKGTFLTLSSCRNGAYTISHISLYGNMLKTAVLNNPEDPCSQLYTVPCNQSLAPPIRLYESNGRHWAYFSFMENLLCTFGDGYLELQQHNLYTLELNTASSNLTKAGFMRGTSLHTPPMFLTNISDTALYLSTANTNENLYELFPELRFAPNRETMTAGSKYVTATGKMLISASYDNRYDLLIESVEWGGKKFIIYLGAAKEGGLMAYTFDEKTKAILKQERLGNFSGTLVPIKFQRTSDGGFVVFGTHKNIVTKDEAFLFKFSEETLGHLLSP